MTKFDELYNTHLDFGYYQKIIACLGCIGALVFGGINFSLTFCLPLIQRDYLLTFDQVSLLGLVSQLSSILISLFGGSLMTRFGRKKMIISTNVCMAAIGLLTYFADSFEELILIYLLLGCCSGFLLNCWLIYLVETLSGKNKGKVNVLIFLFITIGRVVVSIFIWMILSEYELNLWKSPFLLITFLYSCISVPFIVFAKESIRYNYSQKNYEIAYRDFRDVLSMNYSSRSLLKKELDLTFNEFLKINENDNNFDEITKDKKNSTINERSYFWTALNLGFVSIAIHYCVIGVVLAVPNMLGTDSESLFLNILITSGEFLASFFSAALIDNPKIGRKRLIIAGFAGYVVTNIAGFFLDSRSWATLLFLDKIFAKVGAINGIIHMHEAFPIHKKDNIIFGIDVLLRVSMLPMTYLFYLFFQNGPLYIFIFLMLFGFVGVISGVLVENDLEKHSPKLAIKSSKLEEQLDLKYNTKTRL